MAVGGRETPAGGAISDAVSGACQSGRRKPICPSRYFVVFFCVCVFFHLFSPFFSPSSSSSPLVKLVRGLSFPCDGLQKGTGCVPASRASVSVVNVNAEHTVEGSLAGRRYSS